MGRPDRSDAHLPAGEQAKIEEAVREYFEGVAPKRHTKPSRSDYSSHYSDALHNDSIPELDKLRDLEAHPGKLVYNANGKESMEEYVETDYYKDLDCVDKQHHTTGTGFIKIEKSNGSCFNLTPVSDASSCITPYKGNPATNEWMPSAETVHDLKSDFHNSGFMAGVGWPASQGFL